MVTSDGEGEEEAPTISDEEHEVPMILHPGSQGGRRRSTAVFIGNREEEKARALFLLGELKLPKQEESPLFTDDEDEQEEIPMTIPAIFHPEVDH
ncbi:hypothetical protein LSAT2_004588, partial [Lamellibrachia satsuma]